jgi:hypothetical protein
MSRRRCAAQSLHLPMFLHVVALVPSLRVPVPPVMDHRSHRRRCRHDRRRRRRWWWRRRRGAGSQRESRDKSGRAERPASRDKTHVSPPRVESDTLYQLDTQSRAAQDNHIIAPSRLFSMGNLTTNHRNDDHPDLWRRRSPGRNAQYNPSAARRGSTGLCSGPSGGQIHPNRCHRTPWTLRSVRDGRNINEIRCPERQNPPGRNRIGYVVLGASYRSTVARKSRIGSRNGGNQPVSSTQVFGIAMSARHSCPALPLSKGGHVSLLDQAVVLAPAGSARFAIRRGAGAVVATDRKDLNGKTGIRFMTDVLERPTRSFRSGSAARPRRSRHVAHNIDTAARHRGPAHVETR